ncbi:hypothetical protein ACIRP0_34375 [Streptomyces sp. NPDC101733]|uniref:hypothetical protein n=1 Tax=unclassified Streptomyces TaxID=2593676 RepID=UPI0037F44502
MNTRRPLGTGPRPTTDVSEHRRSRLAAEGTATPSTTATDARPPVGRHALGPDDR